MSIRLKNPKVCPMCHKESRWFTGKACHNCYRQKIWQRKKKKCPRYKRVLFLKGKGLCGGCYNIVYRLGYQKARNYMVNYGLDHEVYKKITQKCVICGFDKIIDLHHLDQDRDNNSQENFIGLCPNHHRMLHNLDFKDKIFKILKEKGFNPTEKKLKKEIKGAY